MPSRGGSRACRMCAGCSVSAMFFVEQVAASVRVLQILTSAEKGRKIAPRELRGLCQTARPYPLLPA
ncbi:hypothetical protein DFP92_102542 [Yoonia sediminilitoris]|uniref:Uncharacterized protein n=1 Tax=Yoonia sediminilitoris TaxID=1286148 RepID=A0A2T6KMT2_9RHOB|nr:hypothetical protein C8N45_102542 [Yoonia sediminilitoris]RCW97825.1 hypothetical protein DFP92_102542 [Yoonia sediminilitoris]